MIEISPEARSRVDLLSHVLRQSPVEFASKAVEDAIAVHLRDPLVRAAFDAMAALAARQADPAPKPRDIARLAIERATRDKKPPPEDRLPKITFGPAEPPIPTEEARRKSASALRTARLELGLSDQRDAARLVGLDEDTYHAIECARPVGAHLVRGSVQALTAIVEQQRLGKKAAQ